MEGRRSSWTSARAVRDPVANQWQRPMRRRRLTADGSGGSGSKTPPPLRQWRRGSGSSGSSSTDSSERLRQWRRALDLRKQQVFSTPHPATKAEAYRSMDTGTTNTTAVVSSESDTSDSVGSDVSFSCEGTSLSGSEMPSSSSGSSSSTTSSSDHRRESYRVPSSSSGSSSSSSSDDRRESYRLTDLSASSEERSGSSSSGGSSPLSVVVEEESSSSLSGNNPQYTRRPRGRHARASRHAEAKFAHSISTNNASSSMRDSLDKTNHALTEESDVALESSSSSVSGNNRRPTGRRVRAQVLEKFAHSISINDTSSSMRDSLDKTNHAMEESSQLESSSSFFAGLRKDPMDTINHRLTELSTDFSSGPSTDFSSETNVLPAHPYHPLPKRNLDEMIRPVNGRKVIDESARTGETEQTIPTSNHGNFQQLRSVSNLRREVELEAQRRAEVEAWKIEQWELQMELQREREQVRARQRELRKRALMAREEERRSQGQLEEQERDDLWQRGARQTRAEIKSSDRRQWRHPTSTYQQQLPSRANSYLHLVLFLASLISIASLAIATPSDLRSIAERMALGLFGVAAVLSSLAFVGLRFGAADGRAMTAPIEVDVPHVGVLEFQSLSCIATVVLMAVWTVVAILVLLVPEGEMAVAGQTEVWNANLFFGTWVGFSTASFLFAEGCVSCNNRTGAPLNLKARARRKIARGWALQLIASIVLVAFSAALIGGPACRSGSYLDEESATCARVVCGVVLGVLGMLLAVTYFVARAVRAHRAARVGTTETLVWNGCVDRTSFVLAALAFCVFAANAGLLTAPASGSVGSEPCNLFVSSWICFGLSLYLALRHVEMWSAQPSVRRRVVESTSLVPFGYEQKPSAGTSAITEESSNSSYSESSSSGSLDGPSDRFAYGDEEVGGSSSSESSSSCESVSFETLLEKADEAPPSPVSSKDREPPKRPDPERRRGRPQSYALSSGSRDPSVESSAQKRDPSGKKARRRQKTTKAPLSPQEHISMISPPPLGDPHHQSDEMLSSSDQEMHQSDSALPRVAVSLSVKSSKSAPPKSKTNHDLDQEENQEAPEPVVSGPEGSTTAGESIDTLGSGKNRPDNLNPLRSVNRTCSISALPRAEAIQREEEELFGHISTSTFLDKQRNERIDRRESLFKDPNGLQAALTEKMEVQTARDQRIRGRDMQAMDGVGKSPSDLSQSTASTDSSPGDLSGKPRQIRLDRSVSVISSLQEDENSLDLTMTTYDPLESKAASGKCTKASGGTGDTPHPSARGGGRGPHRKSLSRNKPAGRFRDDMIESVASSQMSSGVSSFGPQTDEDSEAHSFAKTPGRQSSLGFFSQLDINGHGVIDKQKMKEMFWQKLGKELSDSEMDRVFNVLDEDGDGHIDLAEFQDWCLKNFDGSPALSRSEDNGNGKHSPPSRKWRPKAKQKSNAMESEAGPIRQLPPPPARKGSSYTKTTEGSATRSRSSGNTPSSGMDKGFTARVYPPPPVRSSSSSNGLNSSGTDTPLSDLSDGAAQAVRTRRPPPPLRSSSSSFATRRSSATQSSVDEMVAAALRQAQQMKETHEAKQKSPAAVSEEVTQLGPKPALGNAIPKSVERILLEETPNAKQQKSPAASKGVKLQGVGNNIAKSSGGENEDNEDSSDDGNDDIVDSLVKEALSHARGVAQRRQCYSEEEESDSGSWPHDC